jgi:hypothetical protein
MVNPCPLPVFYWWQWHPLVGTFIGILGGLGIIVPWLRPLEKMGRTEKAVWTLVMILLVLLEIRTLYLDRDEHDAEQAQARCEQIEHFGQIADGLERAIANSKQQFDVTVNKADKIFDKTQEAANLAKDGVLELTGADSYMVIYPHGELLGGMPLEGKFDLLNVAEGKHPIWDGRICMKEGSLADPDNLYKSAQEFDLKPVVPTNLAGFGKSIQPSKTEVTSYNFGVSSRGPLTEEELDVQFDTKTNRWEYRLEIWEPQPFKTTPKPSVLLKKIDWTPIPYPRIMQLK